MKFTDSHEWIKLEDNIGTVGVSDHARKELGEIVYVELPEEGLEIKANDQVCVLESTKSAVDIYSPVSGRIVKVNKLLKEKPEKLNTGSLDQAWLYQIELSDMDEYDSLYSQHAYLSGLKNRS